MRTPEGMTQSIGDAAAALLAAPLNLGMAVAHSLSSVRYQRCCEVPPPCWEPRIAGTCEVRAGPECKGSIYLHVSNCDWAAHTIVVTVTGAIAGLVSIVPTTLVVGAQEEATVILTFAPPERPAVLLAGAVFVHGCNEHVVRVKLGLANGSAATRCDVHINDCPDHMHHWYDHFYCPRPCRHADLPTAKYPDSYSNG